jgi:hypothetical protein
MTVPNNPGVDLLPNGELVSRPLHPVVDPSQQVVIPAEPQPKVVETIQQAIDPGRAISNTWYSGEYLLWWSKPERLPPLVTVNANDLPTLTSLGTRVLIGGQTPDSPSTGGGRLILGWAVGPGNLMGFEIGYQFLGTQTTTDRARGATSGVQTPILGRPFINPLTGVEDVSIIASPSQLGEVAVSHSIRVQGWELIGLANLYHGILVKVHALAGYRYFQVNEGLRVQQTTAFYGAYAHPTANTLPGLVPTARYLSSLADQFDAHNRLHGALFGFRSEIERGAFYAQLDTKVTLGRSVEVVKISGQRQEVIYLPGGGQIESITPNGILGQPSNTGRFARGVFAVLPEAALRVGFKFGERSRAFVGYNFVYLSQAVRAADQIDRMVNLTQVGQPNPLALMLPNVRPQVLFDRSDFWVQGLSFGLEWRY